MSLIQCSDYGEALSVKVILMVFEHQQKHISCLTLMQPMKRKFVEYESKSLFCRRNRLPFYERVLRVESKMNFFLLRKIEKNSSYTPSSKVHLYN